MSKQAKNTNINNKIEDKLSNYLEILRDYKYKHNRSPSYGEMLPIFKVKSKQTAYKIINALIDMGSIVKDKKGKILIPDIGPIKLLGTVEAGFPLPADEQLLDTVSLDNWIIEDRRSSFMLKVSGDSMIEAGIRDGDWIIVEKRINAKIGDIVVANVDGAFTLKYLRQDKRMYYLEPANRNFKNIYPSDSLTIVGVLIAVIRKYP